MKSDTRVAIDSFLRRTPVQSAFLWRASRNLAVLAYHEIKDGDLFARQLDHIRAFAHPVTLDAVARAADGPVGLPPRAVLLTFDDGHRDVLEVATPLLRERGMPAVAFVVASLIDTNAPHWWTEVKALVSEGGAAGTVRALTPEDAVRALKRVPDETRLETLDQMRQTARRPAPRVAQLTSRELGELDSAGVSVENHSWSHPCLSTCGEDKIEDEIGRAGRLLEDRLGRSPVAFAYPDGDRDERVSGTVRRSGHRLAFLFDHRMSALRPPDPFHVSRLRLDAHASIDRLQIILSGLHPSIHRIRRLP